MKKKILFLLLLILTIPLNVKALTGSTSLTCDKEEVTPGGTATCALKGNIEEGYLGSYQGTLVLGNGLTVSSITPSNIWSSVQTSNPNLLEYGGVSAQITGEFDIATIVVTASDEITTGIDSSVAVAFQTIYGADDDEGKSVINANKNIRIVSTNNNLATLNLSKGTLAPEFNAATTNYTVTVDAGTVTVAATAADSAATVTGAGNIELSYGTNTVTITVKSEANTEKTYTIEITRPDDRDSGCNLIGFEITGYNLNFNKDTTDYTINVKNNVNLITICDDERDINTLCINASALRADNNAEVTSIEMNGKELYVFRNPQGWEEAPVNEGDNILNVTVTAENGDTKVYKFTIKKGNGSSGSGDNPNPSTNTTGSKGEIVNPQTGSAFVFIVLGIMIISIACIFYYYKKNEKEKNDKNGKKTEEKNNKK